MVSVPRYADWATIWADGSEIVEALRNLDAPTPCSGKSQKVYDRTTESFVARWIASQLCQECPIKNQCLEAGIRGNEMGVWGGLYSPDGKEWHPIKPFKQSSLVNKLEDAIGKRRGLQMVKAADKVLPGLAELLVNDRGRLRYSTKGQCILRNERRIDTPDGGRESIRTYIMTTLMCADMGEGRGSIHLTCSTPQCFAPWHMRYTRGGGAPTTARSVALALYIFDRRPEWSIDAASTVTGLHRRDLIMLRAVSECLRPLEQIPDPVLALLRDAFFAEFGRGPGATEMTALIRICSAADLLDCQNIKDLIDVGETEF